MTNCPAVGCDLVVLNSFNVFFVFFLGRLWLRSRRRCRPLIGRSVARPSCTSKCPWTTYWTLHCSTAPLSKLLWKWHPPRTYWVTQSLLKGLAGKFKENGGCSSGLKFKRGAALWRSSRRHRKVGRRAVAGGYNVDLFVGEFEITRKYWQGAISGDVQ